MVKLPTISITDNKIIIQQMNQVYRLNYITKETQEWINQELVVQDKTLEQLLIDNYLVSTSTIKHADFLLESLRNIIIYSDSLI